MFERSEFNGDISNWNVLKLQYMIKIFDESKFNGDISNWKVYELSITNNVFTKAECVIPYWINYENKEDRKKAIDCYHLEKELKNNNIKEKKIKI
jgi:hypothetical protein